MEEKGASLIHAGSEIIYFSGDNNQFFLTEMVMTALLENLIVVAKNDFISIKCVFCRTGDIV